MHRYAEAEQTLRKAISVAPNVPQPYENLGLVLIDEEKLAEAAPMLQKAISLAPENPDLRGRIARAFEAMGRLSDAETQYREELRLAPGSPVAMNDLAWHLAQRGIKLDEALDLAQRAAKALPNDGGVLDTLGWAYFLKHDYARAEDSLQKALRLLGADNTDAPDVYVHLGKVFEEEKRIEDAVAAYREAIKRNPDQAEAAAALKRLGRKLF
jgi:Tfp pilus assembly protein PilF